MSAHLLDSGVLPSRGALSVLELLLCSLQGLGGTDHVTLAALRLLQFGFRLRQQRYPAIEVLTGGRKLAARLSVRVLLCSQLLAFPCSAVF